MLQTFSRPAAGEQLSAAEMRRLFETVEALTRIQGVPPLRFTWDVAGPRVSTDEPRSIWVRITGKESSGSGGSGSGDGGESAYSGIEQTTLDELEGTQDLEGGLEFFVDNLYLKEVTGNPDVPYDAIVRAYSTQDGPYYTFLYSPGSGTGTTVKILRIIGIDGGFVTAGDGIRYYLTSVQVYPPTGTPPDSDVLIWLAPYYQTAIWGGVPDVYLDVSRAYSGILTGEMKAITVDVTESNGAIGIETGSQELNLPVAWTAFSPPAIACDDDSPVIAPGTS